MSSTNTNTEMSDSTTTTETHTVVQVAPVSDTDCSICFEAITPTSGHATLGCAHRFHLMCVVRWFQEQDGPSSCPCCRHEVGTLDNVPLYPEDDEDDENDDDNESGTLNGWTTDEEEEDEDDTDSIGSLRRVWSRDPTGGQWEGRWILHRPTVTVWDPTAPTEEEAGGDPPEELTDIATEIQRIWRGYRVRRSQMTQSSVTITVEEIPAPEPEPQPHSIPPVTIAIPTAPPPLKLPSEWLMDRMMRVD